MTTLRLISSMATKPLLADLVALYRAQAPGTEIALESVGQQGFGGHGRNQSQCAHGVRVSLGCWACRGLWPSPQRPAMPRLN